MSDSFFSDLSQGFESGVDISAKLQNLRQSRDRFAHEQRQIQMQDEYMSQLNGMQEEVCLLYTSPSPRDRTRSRMPSSA